MTQRALEPESLNPESQCCVTVDRKTNFSERQDQQRAYALPHGVRVGNEFTKAH